MDTTIYWFSGTGNSLAIARRIAKCLDAHLVSLAQAVRFGTPRPRGAVGIVCPVYFYRLPGLVEHFVRRIDSANIDYAFIVLTYGGLVGGAKHHARRLFRTTGKGLDAAFSIAMPGNYIAEYNTPGPTKAKQAAQRGQEAAHRIGRAVGRRARSSFLSTRLLHPVHQLLDTTIGRRFARTRASRDERFFVTDRCTGCTVCVRVCPVGNIDLSDGRPRWHHRCEQCFACIHLCPSEAIQLHGKRTEHRRRYHHPDVSVEELAAAARRPEPTASRAKVEDRED